jgi:hypothetical protein
LGFIYLLSLPKPSGRDYFPGVLTHNHHPVTVLVTDPFNALFGVCYGGGNKRVVVVLN